MLICDKDHTFAQLKEGGIASKCSLEREIVRPMLKSFTMNDK